MRIEILHVRDSDSDCEMRVWIDGERVPSEDVFIEDVDPGRGYTKEDWDENIEYTRNHENMSPDFKAAALAMLEGNADNKYIVDHW